MLAGLKFQKAEEPKAEKKSKKESKAERRKEQKRRKREQKKKDKKGKAASASEASSASSASGEAGTENKQPKQAPPSASRAVPPPRPSLSPVRAPASAGAPASGDAGPAAAKGPAAPAEDFFSSLGSEISREAKLKPDPEKQKVSDREYNPLLRGEKSELATPKSVDSIPKHLCVGDGGAAWRKRAQKRAVQQSSADAQPEPSAKAAAERERLERERAEGGRAQRNRVGYGGGWKASSKDSSILDGRRSPPRRSSRSRSRDGRRRSPSTHKRRSPSTHKRRSPSTHKRRSPSTHKRRSPSTHRRREASPSRSPARTAPPAPSRPAAKPAAKIDDDADVDSFMSRMQSKYSGEKAAQKGSAAAVEPKDDDPDDANALGALAMEAMLAGDMERYEQLNAKLEKKQAALASGPGAGGATSSTAPAPGGLSSAAALEKRVGDRVKVLEEVDASGRKHDLMESVKTTSVFTKGRNKRGNANAVPGEKNTADGQREKASSGYYQDDDVSLEDLMRREKIEGVQDYDANFTDHVLKKGSKFKMLDEDEDEAYALGWYEEAGKKMDAKKRQEKDMKKQINDKKRVQVNLERCTFCMESKRFGRRDALISNSEHVYLCVDGFEQCVLPGQMFLAPMEHVTAVTDMDETAATEMRNYMKCIVRFFEAEDPPRAVLFIESATQRAPKEAAMMGGGPHCTVAVYPIELGLLSEARAYWKKTLDDAECEFTTQHKRVIQTDAKGGVRKAVPKGFAYVHVDFSLGGGYAHIVEDASEFPRNFARDTVAGMCELTILDRAYSSKEEYRTACTELKKRFTEGGFDWTKAV